MKKNFILFLVVAALALVAIFVMRELRNVPAQDDNLVTGGEQVMDINNPDLDDTIGVSIEEKLETSDSTKVKDLEKDVMVDDLDKDLDDLDNIDAELDNLI